MKLKLLKLNKLEVENDGETITGNLVKVCDYLQTEGVELSEVWDALETLSVNNDDEAYFGVCKRFLYTKKAG